MCMYNGKEYDSDTGRIIKKYDIYICDLGEPVDNNLGKRRPCVIIQSDNLNCPKQNRYLVAPIRSDSAMKANRDNIQDIVDARRKLGRIYVPIEMDPDNFKFIDITRIESVQSNNIKTYKTSILSSKVKKNICLALHELLFDDDKNIVFNDIEISVNEEEILDDNNDIDFELEETEYIEDKIQLTEISIDTKNDNQKHKKTSKKKSRKNKTKTISKIEVPENFEDVYDKWLSGEISDKIAMKELGVSNAKFYKIANQYDADNNIDRASLRQEKRAKVAENIIKDNHNFDEKAYSFIEAYELVVTNQLSVEDAAYIFGMSKENFIQSMIDYEKQESHNFNKYQHITSKQRNRTKTPVPVDFTRTYLQWNAKMINGTEAAQQLDITYNKFIDFAHKYKKFKECELQKNN